nr:RecName: Full=Unknown protein 7 [Daucus carota]
YGLAADNVLDAR